MRTIASAAQHRRRLGLENAENLAELQWSAFSFVHAVRFQLREQHQHGAAEQLRPVQERITEAMRASRERWTP